MNEGFTRADDDVDAKLPRRNDNLLHSPENSLVDFLIRPRSINFGNGVRPKRGRGCDGSAVRSDQPAR